MLLKNHKRKTKELTISRMGHGEDLEPILKLRNKVFNTGSDFMQADRDYNPSSIHIVAKYGKSIVAAARFSPDPHNSEKYIVNRVVTDPEYQRMGIGSLVMNAGENAAAEAGAHELALFTHDSKRPFYESLGFTATKSLNNSGDIQMNKDIPDK